MSSVYRYTVRIPRKHRIVTALQKATIKMSPTKPDRAVAYALVAVSAQDPSLQISSRARCVGVNSFMESSPACVNGNYVHHADNQRGSKTCVAA